MRDSIDAKDRLARFFAEDGLPDRDPAFSAQVAERIARQRLAGDLGGLAAAGELTSGLTPVLLAAMVLVSLYAAAGPLLKRD